MLAILDCALGICPNTSFSGVKNILEGPPVPHQVFEKLAHVAIVTMSIVLRYVLWGSALEAPCLFTTAHAYIVHSNWYSAASCTGWIIVRREASEWNLLLLGTLAA